MRNRHLENREYIKTFTLSPVIKYIEDEVIDCNCNIVNSILPDFLEFIKDKQFINTLKYKVDGGVTRTTKFRTRIYSWDDYIQRKEYILSSIYLEFFNEWILDPSGSFELYIDEIAYSHLACNGFCPIPGVIVKYTRYYNVEDNKLS